MDVKRTEVRAEPELHPDCVRCRDLDDQRTQAREQRDFSAVSDCNVLLRRHRRETPP